MATPGHLEPFLLENYSRIIAFTPDLQRVSFYNIIDFLYHSSTTELLLPLILIKGSYPSSKAWYIYRKIVISLVAVMARKFMRDHYVDLYSTSDESEWRF